MTEEERDAGDPWMTLAEIADELRVNPATVRQWVSRGQLKASRAGVRKWIVRRSDLERMLAATNRSAIDVDQLAVESSDRRDEGDPRLGTGRSTPPYLAPEATRENAARLVQYAAKELDDTFNASRYAPPSPGYVDRVRGIADACEQMSAAIRHASRAAGMRWTQRRGFTTDELPYELQPQGNRPRIEGLWDRFDAAVDTLAIALTGRDMDVLADSFRDVGNALRVVAQELERDDSWKIGYGVA